MGTEYWAIVLGVILLVFLTVVVAANLIFGAIKRRRMHRESDRT